MGKRGDMIGGNCEVRRAEAGDSDAVLACLAAAFAPFREQYTPAAYRDTVLDKNTIRHRFRSFRIFLAVADGEVIGTLAGAAVGAEGHLRGMAVHPDWQGGGVAGDLLRRVEEELRGAGCTRITVDTTRPLERANVFYRRHGYQPTGQVADFFGMLLYEYAKTLP